MSIAHQPIVVPGNGIFRAQITDCKFVKRKMAQGSERMLRFRLTWILNIYGLELGETIGGCLAYRWINPKSDKPLEEPELIWSPPKTRNGKHYHVNVLTTKDWYELIKSKIAGTDYVKYLGPSTEFLEAKKAQNPHEVDKNLPIEIGVLDEDNPATIKTFSPEDFLETEEEV